MPTYSYRCTECDTAFDIQQAFTDDALTDCPTCTGRLRKVYNSIGVTFTGSGFYRNDSRAAAAKSPEGGSGSSGDSGSGSKSDSKSESKSDSKSGSKSESKSGGKSGGSSESGGSASSAPGKKESAAPAKASS